MKAYRRSKIKRTEIIEQLEKISHRQKEQDDLIRDLIENPNQEKEKIEIDDEVVNLKEELNTDLKIIKKTKKFYINKKIFYINKIIPS